MGVCGGEEAMLAPCECVEGCGGGVVVCEGVWRGPRGLRSPGLAERGREHRWHGAATESRAALYSMWHSSRHSHNICLGGEGEQGTS